MNCRITLNFVVQCWKSGWKKICHFRNSVSMDINMFWNTSVVVRLSKFKHWLFNSLHRNDFLLVAHIECKFLSFLKATEASKVSTSNWRRLGDYQNLQNLAKKGTKSDFLLPKEKVAKTTVKRLIPKLTIQEV